LATLVGHKQEFKETNGGRFGPVRQKEDQHKSAPARISKRVRKQGGGQGGASADRNERGEETIAATPEHEDD